MTFASLQGPAYRVAASIGRAGRLFRVGLAYAGRASAWLTYLRRRVLALVQIILVHLLTPAALVCFLIALQSADIYDFNHLALRFSDAFGAGPDFKLFTGALWPLHYLYLIASTGPHLIWFGAGVALLVAVNFVHLHRQTIDGTSLKVSMALWALNLALLAVDVARCLLLPPSWDAMTVLGGLPIGHALRLAQIIVALYLWSFTLVTARSRADVERGRGWSRISIEIMGKLRLQAVILFLLGNLLLRFLDGAQGYLKDGQLNALIYAVMGMAVFLFFSPVILALSEAISYGVALLSDGRLIVPKMPSPSRPERW